MASMRALVAATVLAAIFAVESLAAPARDPVTAAQFVERCKTDARFCRIGILAAAELLERNRKLCPGTASKEAMANRVADAIEDILEEDSETFKDANYRLIVEQILTFLWPCEPIS